MASPSLILIVLAALHCLNHTLQMSLPPLYLSIKADLGIDTLSPLMLLGTVYFGTYAAMTLPSGMLGDRFNKKKLLAFGALLNSLALAVAALTDSYALILACMALCGLGGGIYHPVGNALIAGRFKDSLGRALGLVGMGASVGLFGGPVLSGFLAETIGWRGALLCLAGVGVTISLVFWLVTPDESSGTEKKEHVKIPWRVFKGPVLLLLTMFAFREMVHLGSSALAAPMSQMNLGFSPKIAGWLVGTFGILGIISQPLAGTLSDKLGRKKTIFMVMILATPLVIMMPHLGTYSIFVNAAVMGALILATVPVMDATAGDLVPASALGRVYGVTLTIGLIIGSISTTLMGVLYDLTGSYTQSFLCMGGFGLITALLALRLPAKESNSSLTNPSA